MINTVFYHNNFVNYSTALANGTNDANIEFNSSLPVGGNYWSGYKGIDSNSDGIGDTAYSVTSFYVDHLPLMNPWTRPQAVFTESGLSSGAAWSVTFNGQTVATTQNEIVFNIVNGTYQNYSYTVHAVKGYHGGNRSGTFDYAGSSYSSSTVYTPIEYTLKFVETGLPSGTSWLVKVNGTMDKVTSNFLELQGTNGTTFGYTVYNSTLYYSNVHSGSATIKGTNITVDVTFAHYSYINGTVSPSASSVYINGHKINVNNGTFNDTVTAGTYSVVVNDTGYVTYYDNFTISSGVTDSLNISLNKTHPAGTSSSNTIYYIGGGAALVAIIGVAAYTLRKRQGQ